jgi:hypothetical protein
VGCARSGRDVGYVGHAHWGLRAGEGHVHRKGNASGGSGE